MPIVDTDDLIDAAGIAALLDVAGPRVISTWRGRYVDFPAPVIDMGSGRCLLWLRPDIKEWARSTGRL